MYEAHCTVTTGDRSSRTNPARPPRLRYVHFMGAIGTEGLKHQAPCHHTRDRQDREATPIGAQEDHTKILLIGKNYLRITPLYHT